MTGIAFGAARFSNVATLDDQRQRAQLLQSAADSLDAAPGHVQSLYDRGHFDRVTRVRREPRWKGI